jgi:hypothetical protein
MSHYFTLGTPVIVAVIGLVGIWLKHRLDRQDKQVAEVAKAAAHAGVEAALAAARSLPTSNGFAAGTRSSLARIESEQRATRRDVGGMREDFRRLATRVDRLDATLAAHLQEARRDG